MRPSTLLGIGTRSRPILSVISTVCLIPCDFWWIWQARITSFRAVEPAYSRGSYAIQCVERSNAVIPQLDPGVLLSERDYRRLLSGKAWRSDHALPERGILFDSLTKLAFEMQRGDPQLKDGSKSIVGKASIAGQVRIDYDEALDILGDAGEDILATGASLGLLDDDPANDMVFFYHQLVQEYFAARHLLMKFDPDLVAQPFKRLDLDPDDETILEGLGLG